MPALATSSYLMSGIAFFALTLLLFRQPKIRMYALGLIAASALTAIWSVANVFFLVGKLSLTWVMIAEVCRTIGWCYCLLDILKFYPAKHKVQWFQKRYLKILLGVGALLLIEMSLWVAPLSQNETTQYMLKSMFSAHLLLAIFGFSLVEQLFRLVRPQRRWGFKFLALGLGCLFCYDFYMFANALLFNNLDISLWEARGAVNALVAAFISVSVIRNRSWHIDIFLSRQVVFHSTVVVSCGMYLLVMASMGYYIREYGGTWGKAFEIAFFVGALLLLASLIFSGKMRAWFKVMTGKYLFTYRYDYRKEWVNFSKLLSAPQDEEDLRQRLIIALGNLVESPSGVLFEWIDDSYMLTKTWNEQSPLVSFNKSEIDSLIDNQAVILKPALKNQFMNALRHPWLIVPLQYEDNLLGFIVLSNSRVSMTVNWEVCDLLEMASRQAAISLRQEQASEKLLVANQFEGLNRISTFVVHDLKNVVSQVNLIQANAKKHQDNPEFIKRVFVNLDHIGRHLEELVAQLRARQAQPILEKVLLSRVIQGALENCAGQRPIPTINIEKDTQIIANNSTLTDCLTHLIENAQEATDEDGEIIIHLSQENQMAKIVIQDNGSGMSPEFVREKLFRPFVTTKGKNGMGIGVFQAREMVKVFGGNLHVESKMGEGTTFYLYFPCETFVSEMMSKESADKVVGEKCESEESFSCY